MANSNALAKSIGARLSRIARTRDVAYEEILTEFLIERMVARLVRDSELRQYVTFKGGYVSLRVFGSPRFTIDLDAVVHRLDLVRAVTRAKAAIENTDLHDGTWFRHEAEVDLKLQNEYGGTRLIFRTGLGEPLKDLKRAQIVNFDIGTGDPVIPEPQESQLSQLLGEDSLTWRVYSRESIVAEKLHSLVDRGSGSSRSKDIFDLAFLIEKCRPNLLQSALAETFKFRGTDMPADLARFLSELDRKTLQKGWASAVSDITNADLDQCFEKIIRFLRVL